MRAMLNWAGRNGTWVVMAGVGLGFAVPALSELARPCLTASIFVFTFGSLLKVDGAAFRAELAHGSRNAAVIVFATLGVPLATWAVVRAAGVGPELAQGMLFWALVPSSGACVAFAALLRMRVPLALLTTVTATAAAPLCMPWLAAALGGFQLAADPAAMSVRLLAIIGGAWIAALCVRRFAGGFVRGNPDAMTGIAVAALFVAGLGSMRGMLAGFVADPARMLALLALAYALLAGAQLAGTLLFWRAGRDVALTAGLASSTRTITLAWVVLGADVLPLADAFLGCAMIAKYTAPALLKAWLLRRGGTGPAPAT